MSPQHPGKEEAVAPPSEGSDTPTVQMGSGPAAHAHEGLVLPTVPMVLSEDSIAGS